MYDHVALYRHRLEHLWFTREELAVILEVSEKEVLEERFGENGWWISRDVPVPHGFTVKEKEKEYDALSMHYMTRMKIAVGLASMFEEYRIPLLLATDQAVENFAYAFRGIEPHILRVALYRSRQIEYAKAAANSMMLTDNDALWAIELAFCLVPATLMNLCSILDGSNSGSWFYMDSALRYQVLLAHFHSCDPASFFPEFADKVSEVQ